MALSDDPDIELISDAGVEVVKLSGAMRRAEEAGLDCVMVGKNRYRLSNFQRLRFEVSKKLRGVRRTRRAQLAAEIQLHVNISEHDLALEIEHMKELLDRGHHLKLSVPLREPEAAHPELARQLLERVVPEILSRRRAPGDVLAALRADIERRLVMEERDGAFAVLLQPLLVDKPIDRTPLDRRCSFCNRARREVSRLVAGPRVYICDRCASVAPEALAGVACSFCTLKAQRGLRNSDGRVVICTDCLQLVDEIVREHPE